MKGWGRERGDEGREVEGYYSHGGVHSYSHNGSQAVCSFTITDVQGAEVRRGGGEGGGDEGEEKEEFK
jgi:hypothetical protein